MKTDANHVYPTELTSQASAGPSEGQINYLTTMKGN